MKRNPVCNPTHLESWIHAEELNEVKREMIRLHQAGESFLLDTFASAFAYTLALCYEGFALFKREQFVN